MTQAPLLVLEAALGTSTAVRAEDAGVGWPLVVAAVLAAFLGGVLGGALLCNVLGSSKGQKNKPKWPRDWPKPKEFISNNPDPTRPGYMAMTGNQALGSGAMFLGRTYPKWTLIPEVFPLRELRRRVQFATSKPLWIPYEKRFQHFSVLGATGKGKSTSFAIPTLAFGALERGEVDTSYYAIDVKSPQFVRMFAQLYKKTGKEVLFFDPWSIDETLGFEPLWRASEESKDIIAEVISSYSPDGGEKGGGGGNAEFFRLAGERLMRSMLDLAQFWPRRYCNLPCVYQAISSGGDALMEAFQAAPSLLPSLDETLAAIEVVLPRDDEELRQSPRDEELEGALAVLERSGYRISFAVKQMRRYERRAREEEVDLDKHEEVRTAFWEHVKGEWKKRREDLNQMMMEIGEFLNQPEDTRNSIVSTITNQVAWFKDPNIARAFSRDELDIKTLTKTPCLFLVGAPMAKLKVGSLFVASIISNLVTNAVFHRGMAIERGEKGVSKHGVFMLLDEFPQLQIKDAPSMLATFRGFKSGVIMVFQERGQLKQLYNEDATTMEGNTVHKVLLQGSHEETAEFYAQKAIGEVEMVKKSESKSPGEKKNVSESVENVPLMTTQDVKAMRLNGKVRQGMALSVGAEVPVFPMRPIPFYEDPTLRKLLGLKRQVIKKGHDGRKTWKFWEWKEFWVPGKEGDAYMQRTQRVPPQKLKQGERDPVTERLQDPYAQYLEYVVGRPNQFDELVEPKLTLRHIGVVKSAPEPLGDDPLEEGSGRATKKDPDPEVTAAQMAPLYATDIRTLFNLDFQGAAPVASWTSEGISLHEKLASQGE